MMDWIAALPLGWAILLFWCGALIRSTTTYALGRGIAAGAEHTMLRRYMAGPVYQRAMRFIDRWGPWAIPFCFLTVGIQTAVIGTAGVTRMRWRRFIPAALLGSLIWGIIYGTIGMAVVWAVITASLASPWAVAALVVVLAGAVLLIVWRRRRRTLETQRQLDAQADGPAKGQAEREPDAGPAPEGIAGGGRVVQAETRDDAGR